MTGSIDMKMKKTVLSLSLASLLASTVVAAEDEEAKPFRWYIGGGGGVGKMEPDPENGAPGLESSSDIGIKLYGGVDLHDKFSVEGYYANLGEAGIAGSDDISYQVYGVSGLWYFHNLKGGRARDRREGINLFGSAGIGALDTSSNTPTDQKNDYHLHYGGGVEVFWKDGMSLRGEVTTYDEDAHLYSVSLVKRFGELPDDSAKRDADSGAGAGGGVNTALIVPAPVPDDADRTDTDRDGVWDIDDQCPNTPLGSTVDTAGCHFGGVLAGVNFEFNSATLTHQARIVLDGVAQEMEKYPKVRVEVQAHTDSIGSSNYNLNLSQRRALSVVDYLAMRNIDRRRLIAKGYGSSRPISSNYTDEGRRRNRRVEFVVLGK